MIGTVPVPSVVGPVVAEILKEELSGIGEWNRGKTLLRRGL